MVGFYVHPDSPGETVAIPKVSPLSRLEEYRQCEDIQQEVWGTVAASAELLSVTQKYGGTVLGAFAGKRMVGFLFALLARRKGRLMHWSHMMAVREGFRNLGLGFRMKLAHRKIALAQGIKSICWTFDPLQSRNAVLNITRLGVAIEEYVPDCYGRFPSAIEKGLPSDRFVASWRIASRRNEERLREGPRRWQISKLPRVNETKVKSGGLLAITKSRLRLTSPRLLVEIPSNTDAMRAADLELAVKWRMEIRRIFQVYFEAGYRVEDFIPPQGETTHRCFYLLRR